jgi:hypothetical protein
MVTISGIISYVIDIKLVALIDENKIYAQKLKGIESKISVPFP